MLRLYDYNSLGVNYDYNSLGVNIYAGIYCDL